MSARGIYVEIPVREKLDDIWRKTQQPDLHQRWDLRFSTITYLPRTPDEPQRFHYQTRIGFGLSIAGGGESVGESNSSMERTSALRFWSEDPKSLIREGRGYWKYLDTGSLVTFLTWYDYDTRFGAAGKILDRVCFRPLMGWATAWSFDRLRLWIEEKIPPEEVLRSTIVYGVARLAIIFIWLWHGAVPKILSAQPDELTMLADAGLSAHWLLWCGLAEILFALVGLLAWRWRGYFLLTVLAMFAASVNIVLRSPQFIPHAFTPVTLNLAVIGLCLIGWVIYPSVAFAGRCRRRPLKGKH